MKAIFHKAIFFLTFLLIFSNLAAAQTEREKGIELYKNGEYKKAVKMFEKFTKISPDDYLGFYYLGTSLERLEELKDAQKALEKSIKLKPDFANAQSILAAVYFKRNKIDSAIESAEKSIALGYQSANIYYLLGAAYFRRGDNKEALENAGQAIKLNSNFAAAYLLKAYAVMNLPHDTSEYKAVVAKYGKTSENLKQAILLSKNSPSPLFEKVDQNTLDFFVNYFSKEDTTASESDNQQNAPLKILSKQLPSYTDSARRNNVEGTVTLMVAFENTGKINHILVVRGLGSGLDEQAVKAARQLKFAPQMKDGVPVTVVKNVQFSFTIY